MASHGLHLWNIYLLGMVKDMRVCLPVAVIEGALGKLLEELSASLFAVYTAIIPSRLNQSQFILDINYIIAVLQAWTSGISVSGCVISTPEENAIRISAVCKIFKSLAFLKASPLSEVVPLVAVQASMPLGTHSSPRAKVSPGRDDMDLATPQPGKNAKSRTGGIDPICQLYLIGDKEVVFFDAIDGAADLDLRLLEVRGQTSNGSSESFVLSVLKTRPELKGDIFPPLDENERGFAEKLQTLCS